MDILPLTIGSDPELYFAKRETDHFTYLPAHNYINNHSAAFGTDGHSETAELRPLASRDPKKHVENIKYLFTSYRKNPLYTSIYKLNFFSSTPHASLGGHIHFGHKDISGMEDYSRSDVEPSIMSLIDRLNFSLDSLLSFPLMFVENPAHAKKRKIDFGYGNLSDYRFQKHGIEYRTPGSWLATEQLARSVITLAYTIGTACINQKYAVKNPVTTIEDFKYLYEHHSTNILFPLLSKYVPLICDLPLYPTYKQDINYLLYHAKRQTPLFNTEIKAGWKIPYITVRKVIFLSLMELVRVMMKELPQDINANRHSIMRNPNAKGFVWYDTSGIPGFAISSIATNLNISLNTILSPVLSDISEYTSVSLFARHKLYGESILLSYNDQAIPVEKMHKLARILADTIRAFGYPAPVDIIVRKQVTREGQYRNPLTIGLGRNLRAYKKYLSECLVFLCVLYSNNAIYKSYKVSRKTGQRVNLPLLASSIVQTIKQTLVKKRKQLGNESKSSI